MNSVDTRRNRAEVGRRRAKMKSRLKIPTRKQFLITTLLLTSAALTSCNNSRDDYESGVSQENINKTDKEIASLIESYNFYYDKLLEHVDKYNKLRNAGDIKGAKEELEIIKKLKKTIENTEKKINKAKNKAIDFEEYYQDGKVKSDKESGGLGDIKIPPRRVFI